MTYIRRAAFAAIFAAAVVPAAGLGQVPGYPNSPPPVRMPQPPAQTSANAGVALPPAALQPPPPAAYPPGAYGPYGQQGYQGPAGASMAAYASLSNPLGQYQLSNQQERLIQTQADLSRIDYRNALIQQQRYEQSLLPTTLELQQQQQWRQLQAARNNPSSQSIWSGDALNSLFTALQGAARQGLRADPVPVSPDVLKHINLTTGQASGAGAGMLKNLGNLNWPFALQAPPFDQSMAQINALGRKVVEEVKANGRVSAETFGQLNAAVNSLDDAVASNQTLSPTDYILSKGFADNLQSSVQSLRNPDVAQYFNGALAAKGPTVADLVEQMTSQGVHFAPATADGQPAYTVLYQAMLDYDYRLSQLASR